MLLRFYKSVILAKLDYGAPFYTTACKTNLDKLNKVQNNALRIAIGARKTSPIVSLEAESHIPPLDIHRLKVMLQ